jgi:hypothetical protein
MKLKLYIFLLLALPTVTFAGARTLNQAVTNGANWSNSNTWSQSRIPQNGDSIVIPAGYNVILDNSYSLNNVYITIAGTLDFKQNNQLSLDNASVVSILSSGIVMADHTTPNEVISIGGVNKYIGKTDIALFGPALASSSTGVSPLGFSTPSSLPVTFISFSADRTDAGTIQLTWNTENEINNSHFEVERSNNGSDWSSIGTVAAGTSSLADSYTFTDESAPTAQTWYRLRQVDLDGKSMYSKVALISATATSKASIVTNGKMVSIFPANVSGGRLMVRLISLGGQVLQQQSFDAASSRICLTASISIPGIYIVQVTDGNTWSMVQKVML